MSIQINLDACGIQKITFDDKRPVAVDNFSELWDYLHPFTGWVHLPWELSEEIITAIENAAEQIQNQSDFFLVLGVGGSYIGAKALIDLLGEALQIRLSTVKDEKEIESLPEYQAVQLISGIYQKENSLKNLSPEERLKRRQKEVKQQVDAFFEFVHQFPLQDPLVSAKMTDAINYAKNQEIHLRRFLDDGHIPLDNGFALSEQNTYPQFFPETIENKGFSKSKMRIKFFYNVILAG